MANYTVTDTAQTLETIMGTDFDDSKSYNIHINQCAPAILGLIAGTVGDGGKLEAYDGSRGIEYKEFSDITNFANGDTTYFKSSLNSIDIFVEEVSA